MKTYFKAYHLLLLLPVLVLYGNCGSYEGSTGDTLGSQSCMNSAQHSRKLLNFDAETDCENAELISCDSRRFSPDTRNLEFEQDICDRSESFGDHCLTVKFRHYDTSSAEGAGEDFEPGGEYNYQEFNCYMKKYTHNDQAIFQSSAPTLRESLDQLYANCLKGAKK